MIKIYTDGSCLENPGNGGWAAIIINNGQKIFEGTPAQLKRKMGKTLDEKFRKLVS